MIRDVIATILQSAIAALVEHGELPATEIPAVEIERPQSAAHGDYASNIAMKLASALRAAGQPKVNPRALAETIATQVRETVAVVPAYALVGEVSVAGPGFINLRLDPRWLLAQAPRAIEEGNTWGCIELGRGTSVNLEFVSANPTGPVHIGNGRGAYIGDTLGNVMRAAGYDVTKEYYFNDAGAQVDKLGRSIEYYLYLALGETEQAEQVYAAIPVAQKFTRDKSFYKKDGKVGSAAAEDEEDAGDFVEHDTATPSPQVTATGEASAEASAPPRKEGYFGPFYETVAAKLLELGGRELLTLPDDQRIGAIGRAAAQVIMDGIRDTMRRMKVEFDVFFNEASLKTSGALQESIKVLRELGFVKEEEGALWARTTLFGDDRDRVVLRSNGLTTYFASDVAYMRDKFDRGFSRLIFVLGPDHHGYIARLKAISGVLGHQPEDVQVLLYQQVNLKKDGKAVKMGKRLGTTITLDELEEDVGADVTRFFYLMRANDTPLDFDLNLALKQTEENPGLSVQYAHARAASVLRKAIEQGIGEEHYGAADVRVLANDPEEERGYELALVRELLRLEEVVERVALTYEPHHLTRYAMDLADAFHLFYDHCPILKQGSDVSPEQRLARLKLLRAAQAGIARTLTLIGMSAPERMERTEEPAAATNA